MKTAVASLRLATTTLVILACIAFVLYSRENAKAADENTTAHGVTVKGYLRDAECPLRYKKSMKPEGSCAMDCVKKGAPIALITGRRSFHPCRHHSGERCASLTDAALWKVRFGDW
jgi:hypothetical protein